MTDENCLISLIIHQLCLSHFLSLSFMNCIPVCEIIYCVLRFMSPLKLSLSLTTAQVLYEAHRHV